MPETHLVADVLHLFSQSTSPYVEISLMAADAGLVPEGENALGIGGTKRLGGHRPAPPAGDDTLLLQPAHPEGPGQANRREGGMMEN